MMIDDFHIRRTLCAVDPLETNPPLVVDSDAVLTLPVSFESLKAIARQHRQVSEGGGRFQPIQLETRSAFDGHKRFHPLSAREAPSSFVAITDDQNSVYRIFTCYVKGNGTGPKTHKIG